MGKRGLVGLKVRYSRFIEPWNLYVTAQIPQYEAARRVGVSHVIFRKWAREIFANGAFDENLSFMIYDYDEKGNIIEDVEVDRGWKLVE